MQKETLKWMCSNNGGSWYHVAKMQSDWHEWSQILVMNTKGLHSYLGYVPTYYQIVWK